MIGRSLVSWIVFSGLLLLLSCTTQGTELELAYVGWSFMLSIPVLITVQLGGLGHPNEGLHYPSGALLIVGAWILGIAPSLVSEAPEALLLFRHSDSALMLARPFFLGWCVIFVIAAGRPTPSRIQTTIRSSDFIALSIVSAVFLFYLVRTGLFSAYQATNVKLILEPGSRNTTMLILGTPLFALLPPLFMLISVRASSRWMTLGALIAFAASWPALFFLASRTSLALAVATCLLVGRKLQRPMSMRVVLSVGVALPILLAWVTIYRGALTSSTDGATSFGEYYSIAATATAGLNEKDARSDALDNVSANARVRFWYGPQLCIVIDEWLAHGANMRGSFFSGVVRSIPLMIVPEKNALADELEFEPMLLTLGSFPLLDLSPTPIMQWLFELGALGLLIGPLAYGWFVRLLERRLSQTRSFYEIVFWLELFVLMWAPEHTTDVLIMGVRNIGALIIGIAVTAYVVEKADLVVRGLHLRPNRSSGH
jgi:hypothetical protein